jgi:hypothetical protein
MKKLLLVLLVVALAAFLFVGCLPVTPAEGEGEGEGEGEITVEIADSVVVDGKTYVSGGPHVITVTFPNPVEGTVTATITGCTGNYKGDDDTDVVMFPDADKKVWTGSGTFGIGGESDCCASYVEILSGECLADICITFPVIVDEGLPFAAVEITSEECTCEGCELTFESTTVEYVCDPEVECCGDDCSGLASWSIAIYDEDPFDECCETPCVEPIGTCSGDACPISCVTDCLDPGSYWVVMALVDNVGNEEEYYAIVVIAADCGITVTEYYADDIGYNDCLCTDWVDAFSDTDDIIGACYETDNCAD